MGWLLKLLGYHKREYRGDGFSVRIEPIGRELLSVIHKRPDNTLNLIAGWVGKTRNGIGVEIPQEVEVAQISQLVTDLETAFTALRYGYMISAKRTILAKSKDCRP